MSNQQTLYRYCPVCGHQYNQPLKPDEIDKKCDSCDFVHYENQSATVGAVIMEGGRVLLAKRGVDPAKGAWDLPGGFVDPQEHPDDAVIRETKEELGVDVKIIRLLGIFGPTSYQYQNRTQFNTDLYYLVEPLSTNFQPADDVADFAWFELDKLPPEEQIAFPSVGAVLKHVGGTDAP